uniref:Uncharacterized protein n=1 Tax=Picea glauca TaxID=3330 RepID=A0A101LUI2_PICGL|nr:hypothetical protein ABT39_MTgene2416 [Picea glauca]QHR86767.1 hypothetical protein Q903MT_gene771 [Picea sitchensis]
MKKVLQCQTQLFQIQHILFPLGHIPMPFELMGGRTHYFNLLDSKKWLIKFRHE